MVAVDTNVVVRLLTEDDREQSAAARRLFSTESIWIGRTVLLESAWVLGNLYGYDDEIVREAFQMLLGLENVEVEETASVAEALGLAAHGIDFADALRVCGRPTGATFASYDRTLVRRAIRAGLERVLEL